jgi:hypothetical protein
MGTMRDESEIRVKKARDILAVLDPVRGVLGKNATLVFRTSPGRIEAVMYDQPHTQGIEVRVDFSAAEAAEGDLGRDVVITDLDPLIESVRTFGDEALTITLGTGSVVLANELARRELPRTSPPDLRVEGELPSFRGDRAEYVPMRVLRRILPAEKIEEAVAITFHGETLELKAADASGRNTYSVYSPAKTPTPEPVTSWFGLQILGDIVTKMHLKDEESVSLRMQEKGPAELSWEQGGASFRIVIAPRIEVRHGRQRQGQDPPGHRAVERRGEGDLPEGPGGHEHRVRPDPEQVHHRDDRGRDHTRGARADRPRHEEEPLHRGDAPEGRLHEEAPLRARAHRRRPGGHVRRSREDRDPQEADGREMETAEAEPMTEVAVIMLVSVLGGMAMAFAGHGAREGRR